MHRRFYVSLVLTTLTSFPSAVIAQFSSAMSTGPGANRTSLPASELRLVPEDFAKLRLGPGFLVSLNVLDDSDFAGSFRIDDQGNIAVPIIGIVHVAGETPLEAKGQIEKVLLEKQILKHPQAVFTILEYSAPAVTIIGEVASPGRYPLLVPQKLVDVLARAGGPTLLAGNEVQINPGGSGGKPIFVHYSRNADPTKIEDVIIRPGDTVLMKRAGVVYVLGAVNHPGGFVMQEEGKLNILQAISLAYGTSNVASTKTIYLLHKNGDGTEVDISVPYKQIVQGKMGDVQLHATDILYVPTSTTKSVLINTQPIWASAASAGIYAATIQ